MPQQRSKTLANQPNILANLNPMSVSYNNVLWDIYVWIALKGVCCISIEKLF